MSLIDRTLASVLAALVAVAALGPCCWAQYDDDEDEPYDWRSDEKSEAEQARTKEAANRLVEHFVAMYKEHLDSTDWIVRAMAVIGLAQIKDARTTDVLMETVKNDSNVLVRVYAWEALFARHKLLDAEQKKSWISAGKQLARKNALHGDLRVGLVRMLGEEGDDGSNRALFVQFFSNTNCMDPTDMRTLWAMRDLVARWKNYQIIKGLIASMGQLDDAYRAEFVLEGVKSGVPHSRTKMDKGSRVMWADTLQAWTDWFAAAEIDKVQTATSSWLGERSDLIPEPQEITDPADPKWRKDLELRPLRLRALDVVFAVDSTGSMTPVIEWIQRDVVKMMRAFALISREPRIGVIFYRDRGDEYVVRSIPLTGNGEALAKAIEGVTAKGGGDVPEAVYDAMATAVGKMNWTSTSRIVIVVGDAPPHPETMDRAKKLVESSAEKGYRFHFIKARTQWGSGDLTDFDVLGALGKGSSTWINFYGGSATGSTDAQGRPTRYELARVAYAGQSEDADRHVVGNVLRSVLNEAYHDRVDPFVNVLLEYVKRSVPERREHFDPQPPPREDHQPTHGPPPPPPPPPRDPQLDR